MSDTKIITYDKTEGHPDDAYNKLNVALSELPRSQWEIEIRKPTRSKKQNDMIHPLYREVAEVFEQIQFKISFGKYEMIPSEALVKEFFSQCYLGGQKTSKVTTKELAEAVDTFVRQVNSNLRKEGCPHEIVISAADRALMGLPPHSKRK